MASHLAGIPLSMLGCDRREVELAAALVELGADLRLVGFSGEGSLKKALHFSDAVAAVQGQRH